MTYTTAEKQLITTLAWFRSRYALFMGLPPDRRADRQRIETFGKVWMGEFKTDWEAAFTSLLQKNVITLIDDEYSFTDYGHVVKDEVDANVPFYKYEYDNYFQLESRSKAHADFCKQVYGRNLSQHGLIDEAELAILIDKLKEFSPDTLTDMGCGNGKITEWIAGQTQTPCTGIDISSEAIAHAKERTKDNKLLRFEEGNLNDLSHLKKCDCIIFLDTLYYPTHLKHTISQAYELLHEGGRMYAYYSQWIMALSYQENLQANKTHLAKVLDELNLNYSHTNLVESGIKHWKKKLEVLNMMKNDFMEEGSMALWEYRYGEAQRYANWGDDKYARYLYEIRK